MLKESIDTTIITKCILDLSVNLIISELLALALTIKKQYIKAIIEDKTIQFWVNIWELNSVNTWNSNLWYLIGSLKAKKRLENGFNIVALLNTYAKINIMI